MMWGYGDHMSGWGWLFMGVGTLVFWGVLITVLVLVFRQVNDRPRPPDDRDLSAADMLARRLARGEISEDEYASKLRLISH